MATYAPGVDNPDTQSQAETFSPMGGLGMGPAAGTISSETFASLAKQWFSTLQAMGGVTIREKLASLPTLKNIIGLSGGINAGGKGGQGVRAIGKFDEAEALQNSYAKPDEIGRWTSDVPQSVQDGYMEARRGLQRYEAEGLERASARIGTFGRVIGNEGRLLRPDVQNAGGMVPSKTSWDDAINAAGGMNDPKVQRMLGFGK